MMTSTVFLIRNVAPSSFGGGELYQLELARELKNNGFIPFIISNSSELNKRARKDGINVLVPPYSKRQNWSGWRNVLLPIYFLFQKKLERWYRKIIKIYRPKVLNIQSRDDWLAATKIGKEHGVKILWTDHADFKNWVLWNVNSRFKNIIGKKIIRQSKDADEIIFVSNALRRETERMISPMALNNVIVIENGVIDMRPQYEGKVSKRNSFVFVGRVVAEKGIDELIEAFSIVNCKVPEASLDIYGDGLDCQGAKEYKIKFHGATEDPLAKLAEREVFVLPSYKEGMSLSLLEAEMMGKKIIVSDIPENTEVIKNGINGIVVPVRDSAALCEAMIDMISNEKKSEKMALAARRDYEERFDFQKIFKEKMLCLYRD